MVRGGNVLKYMKYLLAVALMAAAGLVALGPARGQADAAKSADLTTVVDDHVPVYPRMGAGGSAVYELSKGDKVRVQFEMEKSSRSWCSIIYEGRTTVSGYVECSHLERRKHQQWELLEHTGSTAAPSTYGDITHVRVVRNQVLVPVTLNYKGAEVPVEMLMDTGASSTVIRAEVARRLGVDLEGAINIKGIVMGGGTINVKVVQLSRMTVGPHQLDNPILGVIEHNGPPVSFDGVLGMDFLGSVDYHVDMNRHVITWTK